MSPPASTEYEVPVGRVRRRTKDAFPAPPKFPTREEEREYLKGRLALAFRLFAKLGFDEGVAGHITVRV